MTEDKRSIPERRHREFEESHPWLQFKYSVDPSPRLWLLLGEAQSKCEHVAGVPLLPETAMLLHRVFLAKGAAATTAIEGNTLSEEEVQQLIEGTLKLPPSRQYLGTEVANMIGAFNEIWKEIVDGTLQPITPDLLLGFNRRVLDGLELEEGVLPGEFRKHAVIVGGYRGAPAQDVGYLVQRLCSWLASPEMNPSDEENTIAYAILRAIIAHLYLAWIHPFGDGNGRTARLLEFRILVAAGVPTPAAHLLSNHYNQTRSEYYRQLAKASRNSNDGVQSFVFYAVRGLVDQLRSQVDYIKAQHMEVTWTNYVHQALPGHGRPEARRRNLVLALAEASRPVPRAHLRALTPELAEAYAGKGSKTLSRDLNALRELVQVVHGGYVSRHFEIVSAFLPGRRVSTAGR